MKTFDGAKLVQQRLEKIYSKYPEGSISKRDVLMTIPMDYDEAKIQQVNAAITAAIYKQAEEHLKTIPAPRPKGRFTTLAQSVCTDDPTKRQKEYQDNLVKSVVNAANSVR